MLTGLLGYSVTLPSSKFPLFPLGIQNQPLLSRGHCCHEHLPASHTVPPWGLGSSSRRGHRAGKSCPYPGPVGSLPLVPEAYALGRGPPLWGLEWRCVSKAWLFLRDPFSVLTYTFPLELREERTPDKRKIKSHLGKAGD